MNLNEALALVQSCKKDKGGEMKLDKKEFENLIFSADETLNLDLRALKPIEKVQRPPGSPFNYPDNKSSI